MKFLRSTIGYMIAGMIVMSVWGAFADAYGIIGGYFAAFIIIGPMWFMNHYLGLIKHDDDSAFVDMGLGIGLCGIFRDAFINGFGTVVESLPTIVLVVIGATIAGLVAAKIEEDMEKD
ncbi:Lin0368 family putative glycerol transporter subunit [Streptococcus sp. P25B114]|uniref:Lin0368 family putative glycerol transporter subunit n=1 Tax=Streptococcus TaxID=1301 RepID=UPI000CF4A5C4|nr:hypothetical protein [Streptococcus suis]NJW38476.1 hypothetical protein [Streptococcus suis]NQG18417.1 hypothetical protein [Streptococcus suis]NQH33642.1 hypothetical protein [Streptococcus suis]NQH96989.1 hypothetical protein [Streptococcus suis]NQO45608.1 hypothetical protein [Streptococcus suis]